ncbi:hypothetical protein ABJB13_09255, partial [Bifidobacterium catenulatum]|uniref:hypothetical protein n=1 Tax=Bifidobacterium catenulatum TaxID=1686 RepID=UPI0032630D54
IEHVGKVINIVKLWLGVLRLQDNHPLPACVRLTTLKRKPEIIRIRVFQVGPAGFEPATP